MMLRQRGGKLAALACAMGLFVLGSIGSIYPVCPSANAAPRAADLGPEAPIAEPSGGFVGQLKVTPSHGPVGTPIAVIGLGFPVDQEFQLVWRTVKGSWMVTPAEYHGREFTPAAYQLATVKSDNTGHISASFVAPEDFGFLHDVVIQQGARLLTQTAFNLDITARIVGTQSGPVGSPIAIEVQGIGWRELEGSWVLLYDNMFTGFMSVVTTQGTARFTIPATGHEGLHIVEVQHSDFGSPYRNTQQSPVPDRPNFQLDYTITAGAPVLPPPPERQAQTNVRRLAPAGDLVAVPAFAGVGAPVVVSGSGFEPGKNYQLNWDTLVGNRMTAAGWETKPRTIAAAVADATGRAEFHFKAPDDLGGAHNLWVEAGRDPQGRHILDCADRVAARRCARPRGHHLPHPSQGRGLVGDRQHLHRGLRQRDLGLRVCIQQPGRYRDHHAGNRRSGLAFHRSLSGDLQRLGASSEQLSPATTDRSRRPSG